MREVFAPADDIADGEMYLKLAADIEDRIAELKAQYKATKDRKFFYGIQDLRRIQREHRKTATHLLYMCGKGCKISIHTQYAG